MSDPISDLKHELLAAAVREQSHAATGREWTRAHSRRRWVIVAVAGLVLVGGLLATPALGIGDRLLSLVKASAAHNQATSRLLPGRATGGRSCS